MGIIFNKNEDENTELSRRINAELRTKLQESSDDDEEYSPDLFKNIRVWYNIIYGRNFKIKIGVKEIKRGIRQN